ncbi:MAG: N-acetylmuramoyl-L-alanine amidase [Marinifilaceae bacterium]|jgi:N-acetylmuramoyl-L-alanine amidase|nr:N-acetylmuramoyl-L-alanine amidase [Marinifilaceae bacterium]
MRNIDKIIIHCSATPNGKSFNLKDIDRWHRERGFNKSGRFSLCCGYHYVIRVDGVIEMGRFINEQGAHCYGKNKTSIGICLIGTDAFNDSQFMALKGLLNNLKYLFPNVSIHGHNEFANKICPGFNVKEYFKHNSYV